MKELFASPLLSLEDLLILDYALDFRLSSDKYIIPAIKNKTIAMRGKIQQEIKDLKFEINRQS